MCVSQTMAISRM
ncbi:hypothetical protein pipiens_020318, partial [Culex pipiens pipiens]